MRETFRNNPASQLSLRPGGEKCGFQGGMAIPFRPGDVAAIEGIEGKGE